MHHLVFEVGLGSGGDNRLPDENQKQTKTSGIEFSLNESYKLFLDILVVYKFEKPSIHYSACLYVFLKNFRWLV